MRFRLCVGVSQILFIGSLEDPLSSVVRNHVNLGLAIDLPARDGGRALVVPSIKGADSLNFGEFLKADVARWAKVAKDSGARVD